MTRKTAGLLAAGILAANLTACAGNAIRGAGLETPESSPAATAERLDHRLAVSLTEWSVTLDRRSVPAGTLAISAANLGQNPHDLVIVRSDGGPQDLPIVDGRVDESRVAIIGRFQQFKSGEKEKQFTLEPGKYLLICNILAHYEQGMVAAIVVD